MASADDLVLANAGLQILGDGLIAAIDDRRRHVEERDFVGALELARVEHDLLAVAQVEPDRLQLEHHGGLDDIDADRLIGDAMLGEDRFDLLGRLAHEADPGMDRAAQAEHAGMAVMLRQPRRVEAVMLGRRAEIPEMRLGIAGEQRIAGELVARPIADDRRGHVADIVLVEAQQRAEARLRQRRARSRQAIAVETAEIDALLEIDRAWAPAP